MMRSLFIFIIIILLLDTTFSQVAQEWAVRYNGPGNSDDAAASITSDNSGNIYVTGGSTGSGTGLDYLTIKYDINGVQQWAVRYNGPGNSFDAAAAIILDNSGNVYVTGASTGSGTNLDYATIKYNSSGVQQWAARYSAFGADRARSLAVDNSGNVYITGGSVVGAVYNYATIKYNSSGVQQWVVNYAGPGNTYAEAYSLAIDNAANVYVTGGSGSSGSGEDYTTIKYNTNGALLWTVRYNGTGNGDDVAYSIALDNSGNIYVTGSSAGIGSGLDYVTIKYGSSGGQQWAARYNGPDNSYDIARSLALDNSGNVYVTGSSSGSGTGLDYATIKYDANGIQQWAARYNGTANSDDEAFQLAVDNGGNVYVTGSSVGNTSGIDYATIKYNTGGVRDWIQRYNGPDNSDDDASSISIDTSGNVYVTGKSIGSSSGTDYATIKYSQVVGIHQTSNEIPKHVSLSQNYPNPFNPSTTIKFALPKGEFVEIILYDLLGREISSIVRDPFEAGVYTVTFDASKLPSGIYFYKLTAGEYTDTKKMLLIK